MENGWVGTRSLGTVNVNWALREMTTSWVTGQSRVCVLSVWALVVYGRQMEGNSVKRTEVKRL